MGLFHRIGDILRSNINDLIARAEDPERMLNAAIEDMKRQVAEAKSRVASSIADQSRLVTQQEREQKKTSSWEEKAMVAVRAGRDDLAMEALTKKREHQAAADLYSAQLDTQRTAVDELKRALSELVTQLEETKRRRNLLIARAKRAEAQRHLAVTLNAAQENSAAERLERLEAHVERQEAEAEATWELAASTSTGYDDDLSTEIARLEAGSPKDELSALKTKMQGLESGIKPKALSDGSERRSEADLADEISNLRAKVNTEATAPTKQPEAATTQPLNKQAEKAEPKP
ncbi:MAG: PspA/IM30 family protein [Myxococcales bacterium]|nr:PspA/IM30 family protein [Myxococcales bacterium]